MNKLFWIAMAAVAVLAVGLWYQHSTKPSSNVTQGTVRAPVIEPTPVAESAHDHGPVGRVPAFMQEEPARGSLPATMNPAVFSGNVKRAYQVAKEIPETLAQLPCYCHCDRGFGHKSLHTCFVDDHGANCGICIGEALMAYDLEKQQKLTPEQVRKRIIEAYATGTEH